MLIKFKENILQVNNYIFRIGKEKNNYDYLDESSILRSAVSELIQISKSDYRKFYFFIFCK